ncbi:MAG: hypothetical protein KAT15_16335, partial [Bacteroidales bacterium]|nr:hypothetical protein [Bacteroidales bacterium]
EGILPVFRENRIGAYNWGLVIGKTQTHYPWVSWDSVFVKEPDPWHHDIFRNDGTSYRQVEVDLIKSLTSTYE